MVLKRLRVYLFWNSSSHLESGDVHWPIALSFNVHCHCLLLLTFRCLNPKPPNPGDRFHLGVIRRFQHSHHRASRCRGANFHWSHSFGSEGPGSLDLRKIPAIQACPRDHLQGQACFSLSLVPRYHWLWPSWCP